jgi:hypothetical protein
VTKNLTPSQRIANAAWLRDQIKKLAHDAESNAKEEWASQARADVARHYARELRRILLGLTWEENFAKRADKAWRQAERKVSGK